MSGSSLPARVAVTGASGNIGTALIETLAAAGCRVTGVCRRPPTTPDAPFGAVEWRSVDLTRDSDLPALVAALRGADAVVHLAWGFQPSHREDYLEELGVGGTRRVAQAVTDLGVPHLVHMSSVGAYAARTSAAPVDEEYPTDGIPSSPYSRHKSAAERLLDEVEREHPSLLVTRLRPGIVGQREAGSALLRYAVPGLVPAGALRRVPVLPLDRSLQVQVVHADDVADAVRRVLGSRVGGAFNLAAEPVVGVEAIAAALGARALHVPAGMVRAAVAAAWHARLEQLDPGWIDLAYSVPLLDTGRAERVLDWRPRFTALDVLEEVVAGMAAAGSRPTPVLRPRTVLGSVRTAVLSGPVHRRSAP